MRPAVLTLALALAASAAADTPQAPKLDGSTPAVSPTPDPDPARALPRTTAICQDPAAHRCRQAPREEDCTAAGEHIFRVVIDTPADVETALAHCRAALAAPD